MKKAAVINDLSGFGKCSLTAAIPVLSVLGISPCPLPTAVLTAQTGYGNYHMYPFTDKFNDFILDWKGMGMEFDGIYSGFVPDCRQQKEIIRFFRAFAKEGTVCLVDPVMGDNGESFGFYTEELRDGMIELLSFASLSTPNLTEACLLTDIPYERLEKWTKKEDYLKMVEEIGNKVCQMGKAGITTVISGIKYQDKSSGIITMGNYAVSDLESLYLETEYLGKSYSGTGDLFASCLFGYKLLGAATQEALKHTMGFILNSIKDAAEEGTPGNDGVNFERHLRELIDGLPV